MMKMSTAKEALGCRVVSVQKDFLATSREVKPDFREFEVDHSAQSPRRATIDLCDTKA